MQNFIQRLDNYIYRAMFIKTNNELTLIQDGSLEYVSVVNTSTAAGRQNAESLKKINEKNEVKCQTRNFYHYIS